MTTLRDVATPVKLNPPRRMDAVTLGPLAGADRTAVAAHYVALARHFYGLAQVLDPTVKVPKPQGRKRKHDEDEGADKPPKKKRENTAYTQYIKDTLPQFRKEVRSPVGEHACFRRRARRTRRIVAHSTCIATPDALLALPVACVVGLCAQCACRVGRGRCARAFGFLFSRARAWGVSCFLVSTDAHPLRVPPSPCAAPHAEQQRMHGRRRWWCVLRCTLLEMRDSTLELDSLSRALWEAPKP